jgi:uncharacterized protein YndB with AHSA1/START domain
MTTSPKPNEIVRSLVICARRETVFRFFTDSERFALWWGAGSRIEPRPGGELHIRYPEGTTASGQVQELVPGERVVFSYGYDAPGKPIPPGGSTVEVTFADAPGGTRVTLRHTVADEAIARAHDAGWRFQLALFSRVASALEHAGAEATLDAWFAAWAEADPARRRAALDACVTAEVAYRDDFANLEGRVELDSHIAATHVHMAGVKLVRAGKPAVSQGAALVRWQVQKPDGTSAGTGASFVDFAPDGRIARVAGFWGF